MYSTAGTSTTSGISPGQFGGTHHSDELKTAGTSSSESEVTPPSESKGSSLQF